MKKCILTIGFALAISVFAVAQDGPGGLGTGTGDAGNGDGSNGVNDVGTGAGGTGTIGGVQGTEAPVDGGIAILFAIGAVYTGVKLSKRKGIYSVN